MRWLKGVMDGKRHPLEMGEKEIGDFLTYLAVKRTVAASTQNQALCALVFLIQGEITLVKNEELVFNLQQQISTLGQYRKSLIH